MCIRDSNGALASLRTSLEINEKKHGQISKQYANTLHLIGVILAEKGDFEESFTLLEKALSIRQKVLPETHADIGSTLSELGSLAILRNDNLQGIEYLSSAAVSYTHLTLPTIYSV
eukprot:TRINITY_DN26364_c0_g1_i1.p1 TRINITY_DN26364_c0_g1~~TRINITY_DN26364_c0_g1_i1.p1  ORF type:complete len:135 (-),score=29.75 TRINITY_DN26364_c0_g1_i1:33-380(-)